MGVYIKGMKIPPNCGFCNLLYHCTTHIGEEINLYIRNICRHPDCPLIEVKAPHGRLIEADDVNERIRKKLGIRNLDYLLEAEKPIAMSIKESPTVIEAEVE